MRALIGLVASYGLGSIPTAYLMGKMIFKLDIRQHGSGNVGATNVFRVMGKKWGTTALCLDILKGFASVAWVAPLFYTPEQTWSFQTYQLISGLLSIAGHVWPIWLHLRGGKGVATSCGVFFALFPKALLGSLLIWIILFVMSRYVSVASIVSALVFPLWMVFFYQSTSEFNLNLTISLLTAIFIVVTHRHNIKRLTEGKENRVEKII